MSSPSQQNSGGARPPGGPRRTAGHAPLRPPGSLRRTSSVDVLFPEGSDGPVLLLGRARDIATPLQGGAPVVLAEDRYTLWLNPDRSIASIAAEPARPALAQLTGQPVAGGLRKRLQLLAPEERQHGTPLYLVLDDIPGACLVSNWAWSQWDAAWFTKIRDSMSHSDWSRQLLQRQGVCIAYVPGAYAMDPDGPADRSNDAEVPDLRHPQDLQGWHEFPEVQGVGFRRPRRIDVSVDDRIRVDSAFQDSANTPDGRRMAVHEYRLSVTADPASLELRSVDADPRVLPYIECPTAALRLGGLIGSKLPDLREQVLAELRGVNGCTHLNDALRALADIPALLSRLPA